MCGITSACIGPTFYGARPIDLRIIFHLDRWLGFVGMIRTDRSDLISKVSTITITSYISLAFGSINLEPSKGFCLASISQACQVMTPHAFTITNSALELQSRDIFSGSVRLVFLASELLQTSLRGWAMVLLSRCYTLSSSFKFLEAQRRQVSWSVA